MEILRQPDSLSLLGNLKEFLISSQDNVTFSLSTEIDGVPTTLITESYIPDADGRISIDVTEICRQYLKTELPGDNVVAQENAARTFTATIGATSVSFRVVNASVRNLALTPTDYLEYNFLTLQPQTKKVSWHSPEYLSYYFVGTADIKAKFYLLSGDTETVTVASITPVLEPGENGNGSTIRLVNKVYTVNTTLSRLMALSSHSTDELQGIVDVWVEQLGDRKSYIQRYVYAPATGEEHHYLAVNSLGGIDTFTFQGEQKISGEIEHQVAENSDLKISVTQDGQRKYRQTTGYLGVQEAEWLWEFLHSNQQWVVANGTAEAIVLQSSSLSQGDITALNSSSFDFVLAREGGLLPESRRDETFPDITVPSPVSDLFFLTPRLIDFPAASGDSEIVFPVQTPYSNTWKYLTLSALSEKLSLSINPDHTHGNLSILNELGDVDGHLTYRGSAIGSGNAITLPIAISDVDGLRTVLNSKANSNHTHHWTDISDRPLRLSDFTNDIISSWALAASKPSYSWSEILNKPTTLTGFGITDGYSSLSTTGSGNAITSVSGSSHALTFTKGNTFVDLASEQTISGKKHISYLDVTGALAIPQVEPTSESGKVFEYIDNSGSFGEVASAVTPADLKDLVLKINGVTKTTYNPSSAASFNVDLTSYATQSWVEAKNYLQGITKAMVEAVLTGNITSHTHSQYLTSHQSLSGYATQTWVQQQGYLTSHQSLANYYTKTQADAKFLTEHQSLENYALKSEIPTSMAWTAITGRPTKLSQFTNDIISSWALAATKPSYSWSEIGSRPTTLSGYGITDGYSSLSTTGSGNAITGVSGSGHALTFTKGNTFVDLTTEQTISGKKHISYLDVTGALAIPQVEPTSESGKVFEYIDNSGSFGEVASAVTPADLKDLVLKINGVTKTTYNPASAASFNVDLTSYATQSWVEAKNYLQGITKAMVEAVLTGNITSHTHSQYLTSHQSLNGYATQSWVEAKNYLQGITKAMVEAVLTGNITSHTHSQYLTSHQSLTGYATESWVQQQGYLTSHQSLSDYYTKSQADAKFLTSHQSLADYALKSEIPTSMAWSSITGKPTKLSQFTNDIISSWALAASKPSYSWTEITSRPTTLASFSGDSTHRLVTDTQISNWNSAYGWGNHADAGYLTSFTESDPTVPAWAKTTTKPSYTLDEVTDGSTRKLSNYVPTTRTINSKALSGNITLTLDDIANGTNRSLANYLPLSGGTLTGNLIFNTSSAKGLYSNNGTLNQRVLLMSSNGDLSIGDGLPANSKSLYLDGYQTYLRFGTSKNYSMTLWSDGTIRSSTGANQLSLGYRSGNVIYPFKNVYSTFNVSTKCAGTIGGTILYGVARFSIQNTKKARTFAIKIPSSMGAYVTFKIVLYSPYNLSPSSTITVSAGAFNLTAGAYCALYPSCSIEGSFAGRVAFARDGNTSSANMYILLGSCNDTNALYQGGMIAIDSIIHADSITNADTIMNFGYELLDLDSESMFTKITECVNADAHFKSVTVEDHVTAPKIDCTSMMLVPTIEPSSVPVGKVAEYIDLTGSFAN